MRKLLRIGLVAISLFAAVSCGISRPPEGEILSPTLKLVSYKYRPYMLVNVVNSLRKLGKKEALRVLGDYVAGPVNIERNRNVNIICRCLFVNPQGWEPTLFGLPQPAVASESERQFPFFPIAFSDGIPFLLVNGYRLGGAPGDLGPPIVEKCKNLKMIDKDLPAVDPHKLAAAARSLIASDAFQRLYTDENQTQDGAFFVRSQTLNP